MAEAGSTLTRHDVEAKIVKRCWEDEAFRKEFTADPAATFVKYLEIPAASLPKIVIHQEEPGFWHIVLQARPGNAKELSEEDLERVAGASLEAYQSLFIESANVLDAVAVHSVKAASGAAKSVALSAATVVTAAGAAIASVAVSIEKTVGW
jgi:hypothetical protein